MTIRGYWDKNAVVNISFSYEGSPKINTGSTSVSKTLLSDGGTVVHVQWQRNERAVSRKEEHSLDQGVEKNRYYPAGVGKHAILYTYTNASGCTNAMSQVIEASEAPLVDAGADQTLIYGYTEQLGCDFNCRR